MIETPYLTSVPAAPRRPSLRTGSLVAELSSDDSPVRKAVAVQRLCQALCIAHAIGVTVHGRLPPGPKVLVANHQGYGDVLAVASLCPCTPVASSLVRDWPLLGRVATNFNALFVDPGDVRAGFRALRRAMSVLKAGVSVLNFPEGKAHRGTPRHFCRGVFGLARQLGVPVVPLALSLDEDTPHWIEDASLAFPPRKLRGPRPARHVVVTVGPSLWACDYPSADDLARGARIWISKSLDEASYERAASRRFFAG
jgi:1-acyl-sn-glycerol-3-phosphate acyltransferase